MIQGLALLLQNAHIKGFINGSIYQGKLKSICVPGLNCYSCPGATGACPLGALQNSLTGHTFRFPYYVAGFLLLFGMVFGRIICGFFCPFGFLQDLLNRIPFPKKIRTFRGDRMLRKLKYVILVVMVVVLPLVCKLTPFFCKYLCPSGTLAGILLALSDTAVFSLLGGRFFWKLSILVLLVLLSIPLLRPFCKYLCPLGAFYGLFNKIAVIQMEAEKEKCIHCGGCAKACGMGVDPSKQPDSAECIRCGVCMDQCPADALQMTVLSASLSQSKMTKLTAKQNSEANDEAK